MYISKSFRVKNWLLTAIKQERLKIGDPVPSENQLVKKFAMSRMTVRKGLEDLEKEGVVQAIPGKGRFVSDPEKYRSSSGCSRVLKIAVSFLQSRKFEVHPNNFYNVQLLNGLHEGFYIHDVRGSFLYGEDLARPGSLKDFDGLAVIACPAEKLPVIRQLQRDGLPVLLIDPLFEAAGCNRVMSENYESSRLLVEHLTQMGHRATGCISAGRDQHYAQQRWRGYVQALKEAGVEAEPEMTLEIGSPFDDFSERLDSWLKMHPDMTSLFLAGGNFHEPVLQHLTARGVRVPEDLSVVAFDEIPEDRNFISLTRARQELERMAKQGIESLVGLISGKVRETVEITIPSEFVPGHSCRPFFEDDKS